MQDFENKVAVITGAASGIGRALAERCAQERMKVVLADIEEPALASVEVEMGDAGASVLAVPTDVSKAEDVEQLAKTALATFGGVHFLCNNAGVAGGSSVWGSTLADWEWVLGVNLWGVIHGVRTFVPIMLAQDADCHIVNTASMAGLAAYPDSGIYNLTKHAVVSLSESLYLELRQRKANVSASVLCPGPVNTRILEARRNRPSRFYSASKGPTTVEAQRRLEAWIRVLQTGMAPGEVASQVFQAVRQDRFYILTHPEAMSVVRLRLEDILEGRNPSNALAGTGLERRHGG